MAKAGLSAFMSPMFGAMDTGLSSTPNPYMPTDVSKTITGVDNLGPTSADIAVMGEAARTKANQFDMPAMNRPSSNVAYNRSTKEMFVNGLLFPAEDHRAALASVNELTKPPVSPPAGDWRPVDQGEYESYINNIQDPSLGRLVSKNWDVGVDNLQLLSGYLMQALGAVDTGQGIVDNNLRELSYNEPYQRLATDIESGSQAVDWFVSNGAQLAPMLVETAITTLIGAGIGGATGGGNPVSTAGGALLGMFGKETVKKALIVAAKKRAAGQTITAAEHKLLREATSFTMAAAAKSPVAFRKTLDKTVANTLAQGKRQATAGGATIANMTNMYGIGVGDIYGETGSRTDAFLGAVPYALLEMMPEFALAKRVFGTSKTAIKDIAGKGAKARAIGSRAGTGLLAGGTAEGLVEASQEGILIGLNEDVDMNSEEGAHRLINSFAAGFGIGGPIGSVANIPGRFDLAGTDQVDLLKPKGVEAADVTTVGEAGPMPIDTPLYDVPEGNIGATASGQQGLLGVFGPQMTAAEITDKMGVPVSTEGVPTPEPMTVEQEQEAFDLQREEASQDAAKDDFNELQRQVRQMRADQEREERRESAKQEQEQQDLDSAYGAAVSGETTEAQRQVQQDLGLDATPTQDTEQLEFFDDEDGVTKNALTKGEEESSSTGTEDSTKKQNETLDKAIDGLIGDPQPIDDATAGDAKTWNKAKGKGGITWANLSDAGKSAWIQTRKTLNKDLRNTATWERVAKRIEKNAGAKPTTIKKGVATLKKGAAKVKVAAKATAKAAGKNLGTPITPIAIEGEETEKPKVAKKPKASEKLKVAKKPKVAKKLKVVKKPKASEKELAGNMLKKKTSPTKDTPNKFLDLPPAMKLKSKRKTQLSTAETLHVGTNKSVKLSSLTPEQLNELEELRANRASESDFESFFQELTATEVEKEVAAKKANKLLGIATQLTAKERRDAKTKADKVTTTTQGQARDAWDAHGLPIKWGELNHVRQLEVKRWMDSHKGKISKVQALRIAQAETDSKGASTVREIITTLMQDIEGEKSSKKQKSMLTHVINNWLLNLNRVGKGHVTFKENRAVGKWLNETEFGPATRTFIDNTIISNLLANEPRPASSKGQTHAYFKYLTNQGLLDDARLSDIEFTGEAIEAPKVKGKAKPKAVTGQDIVKKLLRVNAAGYQNVKQAKAKLDKMLADVSQKILDTTVVDPERGTVLSDYIIGGKFKAEMLGSKVLIKTDVLSKDSRTDAQAAIAAETKIIGMNSVRLGAFIKQLRTKTRAAKKEVGITLTMSENERDAIIDKNPALKEDLRQLDVARTVQNDKAQRKSDATIGKYMRDDGETINNPLSLGKTKLLVKKWIKKLKVNPIVRVFRDQAHMKQTAPELFKRAVAARADESFEDTSAMGYSFGNNIIIFSDRVPTEKALKVVLAHEVIGHNGLRALLSPASIKVILSNILEFDTVVRAEAIRRADVYGISRLEAVEEIIADSAAAIDNNTLLRLWEAIKGAFKKIFNHEPQQWEARYWVHHLRRYARTGKSSLATPEAILKNMETLVQDENSGRYAMADTASTASNWLQTAALNQGMSNFWGRLKELTNPGELKDYIDRTGGINNVTNDVMEFLQTMDHTALKSLGLHELYKMFESQGKQSGDLMNRWNRMMSRVWELEASGGLSQVEYNQVSELLAMASLYKGGNLDSNLLRKYGDKKLFVISDGVWVENTVVTDAMKLEGRVTLAQFKQGIKIKVSETETDGEIEAEFSKTFKPDYLAGLTEDSKVWKAYNEIMDTMTDKALEKLKGRLESAEEEQAGELSKLRFIGVDKDTPTFSRGQMDTIKKIYDVYKRIHWENPDIDKTTGLKIPSRESTEKAETFLIQITRAFHNDTKLQDWLTKNPDEDSFEFLNEPGVAGIVRELQGFNDLKLDLDAHVYPVQNTIREIFTTDTLVKDATLGAARSILGSYVPLWRKGKYQVMMKAYDSKGNSVQLHKSIHLPYYQGDSKTNMEGIMKELDSNELFGGKSYKVLNFEGHEVNVTLKAERSETRQAQPASTGIDYHAVLLTMKRIGHTLSNTERIKLVKITTAASDRKRKGLMRENVAGFDWDIIKFVSEDLEAAAHVISKMNNMYKITSLMDRGEMWFGKRSTLDALAARVNEFPESEYDTDAFKTAKRAFDRYAYAYRHMAGAEAGEKGRHIKMTVAGKEVDLQLMGQGERYKDKAEEILAWYREADNISVSTEDMLSRHPIGSKLKMITVLMQLGGNIAIGIINTTSLLLHTLPLLATYNAKNGTGGGFGFSKATTQVFNVATRLGHRKYSKIDYLKQLAAKGAEGDALRKEAGIEQHTAEFLLSETQKGGLQAALFNALMGSSRGSITNPRLISAINKWMAPFTYTEQLNRRVSAIASYEMEYARAIASGESEKEAVHIAKREARITVEQSQGEYGMFNRPKVARGSILQFPFMYKQFPITSVQLLTRMPPAGRVYYLSLLVFVAGIKGIPFADDLMDLVDTLMQHFGIKKKTVETELNNFFDALSPGLAPYAMRGVLDNITGGTISTRIGMGDLLPLTGSLKEGASFKHETINALGPVAAAGKGIVTTGWNLLEYGAEAVGIKSDKSNFIDVLRDAPLTGLRALSDSYSYMDTGQITNSRGQVLSREMDNKTVLMRMLGFYPSVASRQNDIVRMAKQTGDYAKSVRADFRNAWVKATINKDTGLARSIETSVDEWNAVAGNDSPFYISNFIKSANRSLREWEKPPSERLQPAKTMKPTLEQLRRMYGFD